MMTPERWSQIQSEPAPEWWFCSDWIKGIAKDLIAEVKRLRGIQAECDTWYGRWVQMRERFELAQKQIISLKEEIAVSDLLIAERNRILKAYLCPVHGECVPHVLDLLETLKEPKLAKIQGREETGTSGSDDRVRGGGG